MTPAFVESNMTFGPFEDGRCFRIELAGSYRRIQNGIKIAEFLLLRSQDNLNVWIVEAKSSFPNPQNSTFEKSISDIREKWINAFSLFLALRLNRHPGEFDELPDPFKTIDLAHSQFKFILIVNGHKKDWLAPLRDELQKVMKATIKAWAIQNPSVLVLNDSLARAQGLIS